MSHDVKDDDESQYAVDPAAFAALFFDIQKNMDEIWKQMASIVRHAARGVTIRRIDDMKEFQGDALTFAISSISKYDPKRGRAYHFFYTIVRRQMRSYARRFRPKLIGEDAGELAFDDLYEVDRDSQINIVRDKCANNWKSFILQNRSEHKRAENYFQTRLERAKVSYEQSDSHAEKQATLFMIAAIRQDCRALTGILPPSPVATNAYPLSKAG